MTALNCRTAILTYTRGRAQLALSQKSRARTVHLPFAKMIDSSRPSLEDAGQSSAHEISQEARILVMDALPCVHLAAHQPGGPACYNTLAPSGSLAATQQMSKH